MTHPERTRYPDYDVLAKWSSPDWDDQTRAAVGRRLFEVPEIRFFTLAERRTYEAVADRIVPQPGRDAAQKVPIVPFVDAQLYEGRGDGYRYDGMPPQREAWRLGAVGLDESAAALYPGRRFIDLEAQAQDEVLRRVQHGNPPGEIWRRLPARRFFLSLLSTTLVKIYYGHPTAWNEVGYNGPSSPRGHMRIWEDGVDPWEAHEARAVPAAGQRE